MKTLPDLYNSHTGKVSDKWALYLREYDRLFASYREQTISMLEIGIQNGGSLEIWSQYFPNAQKFVGCDINPDCAKLAYADPRISVIVGDATAPETQAQVLAQSASFDLIIEDGSHTSSDIVKAFARYFPSLKSGGLFVAEDLHCSYWQEYEGGIFHPYSSITFFKHLADMVNHEHWGVQKSRAELIAGFKQLHHLDFDEMVLAEISSIEFLNSICVVRKKEKIDNLLGRRIVAGVNSEVMPVILSLADSKSEPLAQVENLWSTLDRPPAETYQDLVHEINMDKDLVVRLRTDIKKLRNEVQAKQELVEAMQSSRSWRYTAVLRKAGNLARPSVRFLRRIRAVATHTGGYAALVYKVINLGRDRGFWALINRIRSDLLVGCNYGDASGHQNENLIEEGVQDLVVANERVVPLLNAKPLEEKEIKLICFYLPQFHTFSENDKWWGKGFTEWTNVRPAKPQYLGHYQPHIPGELGYYNLLDSKTQMRQIELAKLYGIEGFCFYFYWFAGHRLMEQPILNYLNNESLDLPFCLCWANENWSRRWDGLDSEILIAQAHSPDDDLDFISHVSMYFKDKRYIRIDGKPLLLVYRPSLLPSAKNTVARWRSWCRDNGIGEIYLAYTQSFDSVNPSRYGFDAAIEFPPNNMNLPSVTHKVNGVAENFSSSLFDWKEMVRRSRNYLNPGYKLFRGVNPSWDNTARRKNKGNILYGSNPIDYQEWLLNALNYTKKIFPSKDERMVFVNAWNEWAEGAHLEPDEKYGYAYLDATRMAQVRALPYVSDQNKSNDLAVVIHVFYYDVFVEILENLEIIKDVKLKLFITVDASCYEQVERRLQEIMFEYSLISVENKGRDVLPFLKAMDLVCAEGYASFLKIHTKKSKHRADGDIWRKDLYAKLMSPDIIKNVLSFFENNKRVGLIAPSGHLVDMGYYLGSNHERIEALSARMGVRLASVLNLKFAAGTMFIARCDAMMPLINLHLCDEDFESELGQVDGTLAHAIERLISVSCFSKGFEIFDTELEPIESSGQSYKFASAGVNI